MDETRLREQLERMAGEAVPPDAAGRRTLARARRRRALIAGATSLVVLAVVVAGIAGVRSVLDEPVTLGQDPSPPGVDTSVFPGMWPESSAEALAETQAQVDDGHTPLRTTAEGTATLFATDVIGWEPEDVEIVGTSTEDAGAVVELRNAALLDMALPDSIPAVSIPATRVALAQLGRSGPGGVWTVLGATTELIELDAVPTLERPITELHLTGSVTAVPGVPFVTILEGPAAAEVWGTAGDFVGPVGPGGLEPPKGFRAERTVPPTMEGRAMVLVSMPLILGTDPSVAPRVILGVEAFPIRTEIAEPEPTPEIHLEGAPPDVAVTAQLILDGVLAHDLAALDALIDQSTFAYDFGDAGQFAQAVRDDPSLFDTIAKVLALPFWVNDTEGSNVTYVWPGFMEPGALDHLTDAERAQLNGLGFSDDQIDQMASSGGYLGPRLGIAEDGTWIYFVTGGD